MTNPPLTFEEAVGRVFAFDNGHTISRFYVCRRILNTRSWSQPVIVINLETSTEVALYDVRMNAHIPVGWKEILP